MRLERRTAEPVGLSLASRGPPAHRSALEGKGSPGRSRIRPRQLCVFVVELKLCGRRHCRTLCTLSARAVRGAHTGNVE
eukprot:517479-Pleurochrysis_carterae.AAC.1